MEKVETWKRILKGLGIGLLVGLSSFMLITIPVAGLLFLILQIPAYLIIERVPGLEFPHLIYLVIVFWGIIGAILGYLYAYKKTFIVAIIGVIILLGGTTLLFLKEFAETMSHF